MSVKSIDFAALHTTVPDDTDPLAWALGRLTYLAWRDEAAARHELIAVRDALAKVRRPVEAAPELAEDQWWLGAFVGIGLGFLAGLGAAWVVLRR